VPYRPVQFGEYFTSFRSVSIDTGPVVNPRTGEAEYQECTVCHRIGGTGDRSGYRLAPAFERSIAGNNPFMPYRHRSESPAEWQQAYAHHVQALRCCAENPNRIGCYVTDLATDPVGEPIAGTEEPPCAGPLE
jgi:hypothetical protein